MVMVEQTASIVFQVQMLVEDIPTTPQSMVMVEQTTSI